jgi:tRNA (mo5U34)-methyltransferase
MSAIIDGTDISSYYWWHSIRLDDGRVTSGAKSLAQMDRESAILFDPIDLRGKSVLDVGAWNGGFSIEAKRRSAARVVALDYHAWCVAALRGKETFDLACKLCKMKIESVEIDLDGPHLDLSELGLIDIVLFSGVFYHLVDPIRALRGLSRLTKEALILETHLEESPDQRPMMIFYPGAELNNDSSNWWGPNRLAVEKLMEHFGFSSIKFQEGSDRHRGVFHGLKS